MDEYVVREYGLDPSRPSSGDWQYYELTLITEVITITEEVFDMEAVNGIQMDRIDNEKDIWEVKIGTHVWTVTGLDNVRRCVKEAYTEHLENALDVLESNNSRERDIDFVYSEPAPRRPWWGISSGNIDEARPNVPWTRKE